MKKFLDFSGLTYLYSKIVEYINNKIAERVPFKLGIDSNGNYGYYKEGADTVTPFKRLVKAGDITISYITNTFDLSQYKNITINDILLVVNSFDIVDTAGEDSTTGEIYFQNCTVSKSLSNGTLTVIRTSIPGTTAINLNCSIYLYL